MRVDKVILRAVLSTLAAIVALFVLLFSALAIIYPSTMMQFTYDLGMDGASIHFATRAYERSEEVYYAAFATEVAIGIEDYAEIDSCGEKLIKDKKFGEYCQDRDEKIGKSEGSYQKYIYGQVCVAKYQRGKVEKAIARAFELNGTGFAENNPVASLLVAALVEQDENCVSAIVERLNAFDRSALSESEQTYLDSLIALAEGGAE
ncbi:MAG: hypothetical protein IJ506_06325 [Clostridia bacterium]|nr:hypothetical protein [Clostridia bacterium]